MSDISVVGGFYGERCVAPDVDELYGSGGRAAVAIARAGASVDWNYYCPDADELLARSVVSHENIVHHPHVSDALIQFRYFHPLSRPQFIPRMISLAPSIAVDAKNVLRFGFMEGDAVVHASNCVYDPQSPHQAIPFSANGSSCERLAVVLNSAEVIQYAQVNDESEAIRRIFTDRTVSVVLVKAGAEGCRVYEDGKLIGTVPPFWSDTVYKIGTGDVFSAAFAYNWMLQSKSVLDSAEIASRCVAQYCMSRTPTVCRKDTPENLKPVAQGKSGQVYIAGPFFTMAELWLIEEACAAFSELGMQAFSPYHEVGFGSPSAVVTKDLAGLENSSAVLAVLDGCDAGTLFEIGYAVKLGIPVVALSQNPKEADQTMILGSDNCYVTNDFATAIYRSIWEARR
ncbi:PfkB family carbohydrate kinase [Sulfitobacter sp.]|uniref:PfkB family carbohydrate kinase n=1 Tax=Sulfitobacter sp. TaxID=1903071 RepID=UPI003563155C